MYQQVNWQQWVDHIVTDNRSGASEIARNCARMFIAYADETHPADASQMSTVVLDIARRILRQHPSMAAVVRILNEAVSSISINGDVETRLEQLRQVCCQYIALTDQTVAVVAKNALQVLPRKGTVLTLSYSSAVARSLVVAKEKGHQLRVICLESRPMCEGRTLAAFLSSHGLDVLVTIDAAAYGSVREAALFLVGADGMTDTGVVNKVGTTLVATAAQSLAVPSFVLADTYKVWPRRLGHLTLAEHPEREVWDSPPSGVRVRNRYFELTLWNKFAGVVTERGTMAGEEIAQISQEIRVEPEIKEILDQAQEL